MKIGIDARFMTHPQAGGFKTYSQNLVRALAGVDADNEYVIYVDRPPLDGMLLKKDNFCYRVVRGFMPGLETAVREQFLLRRAIQHDRPDVIHFLCNTAPVNFDMPYILTLHDTIQVTAPNRVGLTLIHAGTSTARSRPTRNGPSSRPHTRPSESLRCPNLRNSRLQISCALPGN